MTCPLPTGVFRMLSSLLLLLLSCLWPVDCEQTRKPNDIMDIPKATLDLHKDIQDLHKDITDPLKAILKNIPLINIQDSGLRRSRGMNISSHESSEEADCLPTDGTSYTGQANTTVSGQTCKVWSNTSRPETGDHNYCRNPSGFPPLPKVWCYTTNDSVRWEECGLPLCLTYATGI